LTPGIVPYITLLMNTNTLQVAHTILAQLGGIGRLQAMTGAKSFVGRKDGVTFKIGKNAMGVSCIAITLTPADTYEVCCFKGRKFTRATCDLEVYAEDLKKLIEDRTGMYLSL
jgi:hypothetical protein